MSMRHAYGVYLTIWKAYDGDYVMWNKKEAVYTKGPYAANWQQLAHMVNYMHYVGPSISKTDEGVSLRA